MNKSLRQLFTIVVALFVILGMSTTIITAIRSTAIRATPAPSTTSMVLRVARFSRRTAPSSPNPTRRTTRSPISAPMRPASWMRRSPASSPSASAVGAVSKPRAARCCRANPTNWCGSGSNRCSPAKRTRARPSKHPSIRRSSRPPTTVSPTMTARPWPSK